MLVKYISIVIYLSFLQFEDAHDAEDAIRGRDGYDVDGHRLRVREDSCSIHKVFQVIIYVRNFSRDPIFYVFYSFMQVELAHGGRGSASTDRYNSFSSGGGRRDGGLPRHSDYRGKFQTLDKSNFFSIWRFDIASLD